MEKKKKIKHPLTCGILQLVEYKVEYKKWDRKFIFMLEGLKSIVTTYMLHSMLHQ